VSQRPALGVASTILSLGDTQVATATPAPADGAAPAAPTAGGSRYTVLDQLGEGGMGTVQRVWDADLMRELAVKRLRPELRGSAHLVDQFLWEARVTAYLDHPNIVPVHDLGLADDGDIYFTMKRAAGTALDRTLDRLRAGDAEAAAALPLPRRLRLFDQLCHAIEFAHARGVLHRDLKPGNVVLGEHGEVLVIDWGLATPLPGPRGDRLRAAMPSGLADLSAGTPLYMSPEQARGEPLDERSDVFTLGVILYELTSLATPFTGPSAPTVVAQIASGTPRPLAEVWADAPPSLIAVVERALAHEPAERYPSVATLAADVERILDGQTPDAETVSMARRFARFYVSRDPAMGEMRVVDIDLWAGGAFFLGLGIGLALTGVLATWWAIPTGALGLIMATPPTRRWLRLRAAPRRTSGSQS
jgi:serine/threonine protein kinase